MNAAVAWAAIAVGAVAVLGVLGAIVRLVWKVATSLRDNTLTTNATARTLRELSGKVDRGFGEMGERLRRLEGRRRM